MFFTLNNSSRKELPVEDPLIPSNPWLYRLPNPFIFFTQKNFFRMPQMLIKLYDPSTYPFTYFIAISEPNTWGQNDWVREQDQQSLSANQNSSEPVSKMMKILGWWGQRWTSSRRGVWEEVKWRGKVMVLGLTVARRVIMRRSMNYII